MAALRTVGLGALILLFVNPARSVRVGGGPPTVLLDVSLSMDAAGGHWQEALDTARALAGDGGLVLRFGAGVAPFDTQPPVEGVTRLRDGLTAARARGAPTVVVTDGEITDANALPPTLLLGTTFVLLPRDTVPGAALLDVHLPNRAQRGDSVAVSLTVGTWGALQPPSATVEVHQGERRLLAREVDLPAAPGTARRRIVLRPNLLRIGEHVLRFRLVVPGDHEVRDNERLRVITVSEQPAVVVIVDPADWEGRFLVRALADVARTTVRGYARIGADKWIEMRSLNPVSEATVRSAARSAGLLVLRGSGEAAVGAGRRGPVWHWPAGSGTLAELFAGDWYVSRELPVSPLAGRLAAVEWDSLPPLTGVVPLVPGGQEWLGLWARQGRRGAARPVLVGVDSAGIRELTTAGAGLWRWAFRGGAAGEAYRTILALGADWLLQSSAMPRAARLSSATVAARGVPVVFRWRGDSVPDSTVVVIEGDDGPRRVALGFDADGVALVSLEPGIYRWTAPALGGERGLAVVEPYSDEFPPGTVASLPPRSGGGMVRLESHVRDRWWLFVVALLAFVGEWAWRQRRGLP